MEANIETTVIPVIVNKLDGAVKSLNRLKKRVNKRHSDENAFIFTYNIEDSYIKKVHDEYLRCQRKVEVVDVTVTIMTPEVKYEDYEYVATLKSSNKSNEVYPIEKYKDDDFSQYFDTSFRCDHCNTKRARNQVHLFRDKNGKEIMVANSCSQDYFGIDVSGKIASILWYRANIVKEFGDLGGYIANDFDVEEYTKLVFGIIHRDGGYKKTVPGDAFEPYQMGTKDIARCCTIKDINNIQDSRGLDSAYAERENVMRIADENGFDFDEYISYWENIDVNGNTFINNCRSAVFSDDDKEGFRAYSVWHIVKAEWDKKTKETEAKNSLNEYIGEVGAKIELTLTVHKYRLIESDYGSSIFVSSFDTDGRNVVFFDNKCRDYEIGQVINVTAKVKKHEEYNGRKQTTIYYVKY
jgi:hypothetical protein